VPPDTETTPIPRSLVWATDLDVLPPDRVIERRDGYLVVRSPANPAHYWGNLLLFEDAPTAGDGPGWEARFELEFADEPRVRHRTFAWDRADGAPGAAREEFGARGYAVEESVGLVAGAGHLRPHARENREVEICALDPAGGLDEARWSAIVELQVATRDEGLDEHDHRVFTRAWLAGLRAHFRAGRGAWYVAIDPAGGDIAGSCGLVVTGGRGRFQSVVTAAEHRRRGVCSRLVVEAARRAVELHGADRFVIVADEDYHALGLYESLGFERQEHVVGVCLKPGATP
jgi:ribosomal protein S18 acetylase RimI-like enzyme